MLDDEAAVGVGVLGDAAELIGGVVGGEGVEPIADSHASVVSAGMRGFACFAITNASPFGAKSLFCFCR